MYQHAWDETVPPGDTDADFIDENIRQGILSATRERIEQVLFKWVDDVELTKKFPGWIVKRILTTQSAPGLAATTVDWDVETRDTDDFFDLSGDTEKVTIPGGFGGLYLVGSFMNFNLTVVAGTILLYDLQVNNATVVRTRRDIASNELFATVERLLVLSDSDFIDLTAFHDETTGTPSIGGPDPFGLFGQSVLYGIRLGA